MGSIQQLRCKNDEETNTGEAKALTNSLKARTACNVHAKACKTSGFGKVTGNDIFNEKCTFINYGVLEILAFLSHKTVAISTISLTKCKARLALAKTNQIRTWVNSNMPLVIWKAIEGERV